MQNYDWGLHPAAEDFLVREVARFMRRCPQAKMLEKKMNSASTHMFDWIDFMAIPEGPNMEKMGFTLIGSVDRMNIYKNEKSVLFPVLVGGHTTELAIKPENMEDFVKKTKIKMIEGAAFSAIRKATISSSNGIVLSAVERRGSTGYLVEESKDIEEYKKALKAFANRKRKFGSDKSGMDFTQKLVSKSMKKLKAPRVADAFFRGERAYWQTRNRAGQIQKKRQDEIGLGWGNHDHHTYRSSRENFRQLIEIFEGMGYKCREQFYAGEGAGWGAQILEHPDCEIVIFADVDITRSEKETDIAHRTLKPAKRLGTVGLWIGLHGESILQAGMHHLEARFDFDKLGRDLKTKKINVMKPFSYFDFLKQAFTEGEVWPVEKKRLDHLLKSGLISRDQYKKFRKEGAIGSHMENLQRRQGYKGFNQDSVTAIIKATDPRKQVHHHKYA